MFDSIKNWLSRTDRHQAERQRLEAEAKDFRLPGEVLLPGSRFSMRNKA